MNHVFHPIVSLDGKRFAPIEIDMLSSLRGGRHGFNDVFDAIKALYGHLSAYGKLSVVLSVLTGR